MYCDVGACASVPFEENDEAGSIKEEGSAMEARRAENEAEEDDDEVEEEDVEEEEEEEEGV